MKNWIQPGATITVAAPAGGVVSGAGVLIQSVFGVALYSAAEGASLEIAVVGVFDLPKAPSQAWTALTPVYWDAANYRVTNSAAGNKLIGVALIATGAGVGETIGRVRLNGAFGIA